jgi:hypothetical protein
MFAVRVAPTYIVKNNKLADLSICLERKSRYPLTYNKPANLSEKEVSDIRGFRISQRMPEANLLFFCL